MSAILLVNSLKGGGAERQIYQIQKNIDVETIFTLFDGNVDDSLFDDG